MGDPDEQWVAAEQQLDPGQLDKWVTGFTSAAALADSFERAQEQPPTWSKRKGKKVATRTKRAVVDHPEFSDQALSLADVTAIICQRAGVDKNRTVRIVIEPAHMLVESFELDAGGNVELDSTGKPVTHVVTLRINT